LTARERGVGSLGFADIIVLAGEIDKLAEDRLKCGRATVKGEHRTGRSRYWCRT
jgi:hypothetical protein